MKDSINFILQGKGGVGKSFVSSMLAQYFKDHKEIDVSVADTDPVNASTARIKALNAALIEIVEHNTVMQSKFDSLFEALIENDGTFVIDNGASTFLPMLQYFHDNDVISLLDDMEKETYIHTIIVGGQAFADTINGFEKIYELVKGSKVKVVVWINEFQGIPIIPTKNGNKELINSSYFDKFSDNLAGVITIVNRNSDAFSSDLKRMTEKSITLIEAKSDSDFNVMAKSRLHKIYNEVYAQLDSVFEETEIS